MFENCGAKIKGIAKIAFILCLVIAVIALIAEFADMRRYLFGSLAAIIIVELILLVAGYISAIMIFGFGRLVEDVHSMREDQAEEIASVRQNIDNDKNEKKLMDNGGWKCRCGKVNASYISSCSCGASKFDQK